MSDFEELAKALRRKAKFDLIEKISTYKETYPCSYGGGNCIISHLKDSRADEYWNIDHYGYCNRARQIREGFLGTKASRANKLERAGCPYPEFGIFGWKCKFADGELHKL